MDDHAGNVFNGDLHTIELTSLFDQLSTFTANYTQMMSGNVTETEFSKCE